MDKKDHVLPNGQTFIAIECSDYGKWAKSSDPISAMKKIADSNKRLVRVYLVTDKGLRINDWGELFWAEDGVCTPIGLFTITNRSIKATQKDDFNASHPDCNEWLADAIQLIESQAA